MSIYYSVHIASISPTGDFAAFYCAGSIAIEPEKPNSSIYDQDKLSIVAKNRSIKVKPNRYLYSIPAAYLFAPLSFLKYETAKIVFNLTNLFFYIAAGAIILYRCKWFFSLLTLALFWNPFLYNQKWLQSNTLVFLLIVLAVLLAEKNKPILSGILFSVTVLIKVFPIAIVLVLAFKNWRILLTCLTIVTLSLLLPHSTDWFLAITNSEHHNYAKLYIWLNHFGSLWYFLFVIIIAGVTAFVAYRARHETYQLLAALSIPAMLLTSYVVGGYYLVLLIFSFFYIAVNTDAFPKWVGGATALSFFLINYTLQSYDTFAVGLFMLWLTMIYATNLKASKK